MNIVKTRVGYLWLAFQQLGIMALRSLITMGVTYEYLLDFWRPPES